MSGVACGFEDIVYFDEILMLILSKYVELKSENETENFQETGNNPFTQIQNLHKNLQKKSCLWRNN